MLTLVEIRFDPKVESFVNIWDFELFEPINNIKYVLPNLFSSTVSRIFYSSSCQAGEYFLSIIVNMDYDIEYFGYDENSIESSLFPIIPSFGIFFDGS